MHPKSLSLLLFITCNFKANLCRTYAAKKHLSRDGTIIKVHVYSWRKECIIKKNHQENGRWGRLFIKLLKTKIRKEQKKKQKNGQVLRIHGAV